MAHEAQIETPPNLELTLSEWFDLPEDIPGEWVNGRLVEEEVPDFVHEILVMLLGRLFGNWVFPSGGAVVGSEAKLALDERGGRKPDLSVYFPGTALPSRRGALRALPDLVVEVTSPQPRDTRRDRVDKLVDYAGAGIPFYWIVDPELRSVEILELGRDGRYVHALAATEGRIDRVPGCEGLTLDLDDLWQTVERLAPSSEEESSAAQG